MLDLINLYESQLENLKSLLIIAGEKQQALVNSDNTAFTGLMQKEEQVLSSIRMLEQKRIGFIHAILPRLNVQLPYDARMKLSEFLARVLPQEALNALVKVENETRSVIKEITDINERNLFLIQHLRKFYQQTINNVMALQQRRTIVDRKV